MKILIVDDNYTTAKLLLSFFDGFADCSAANSGSEALEAVQHAMQIADPYDLICLDIVMPVIDGHEVLRTIRELQQSTFNVSGKIPKIIMISSRDDMKTIMESFKQLCDGYLVKPVKRGDLLAKMEEIGVRTMV